MKTKVLLLTLLLFVAAPVLRAQFVPYWEPGDLKKKGTKIAVRGEKLDKTSTYMLLDSVGGEEMTAKWRRDTRLRNWGLGLTVGGFTAAAVGFGFGGAYLLAGIVATIFVAPFGEEAVDDLWDDIGEKTSAGAAITTVGTVVGLTGVVLLCIGNRHMRKTVRYINGTGKPQEAEIVLGPVAPDRVGLALRF